MMFHFSYNNIKIIFKINLNYIFNGCEHHSTFTLVCLLFEIIIHIFLIQITSIWVLGKQEKTNLQNTKNFQVNMKVNTSGLLILTKILGLFFQPQDSLSFKSESSATHRIRDIVLFFCDMTNLLSSLDYNPNLYLLFEALKIFDKCADH